MKNFQPQYWSKSQNQWCDIQGYKCRGEVYVDGLIQAETGGKARKKFNVWIRHRFSNNSQLEQGGYAEYSYMMREVV